MSYSNIKAFTLVELIVVITIVGILSTVGFVSYSGYLTGARDSNRFSQLTKLSDSLQTYAASKSLPLPDDYIEITASGATNVIAYQGYVGVDVLETIDYTNGGKDPKDDSYFTYYLTKDRKSLQLLALMEDGASANTDIFQKSYAVDYEERFPRTYGNKLGVLTDTTNTPVQEIGSLQTAGFLDIFHTADEYTAYFGENGNFSGTGSILGKTILGEGRLVGAWSFNNISGNTIFDDSGNYNGSIFGTPTPTTIIGKNGNALDFVSADGSAGAYIDIPINEGIGTGVFTFAFWMNPDEQSEGTTNNGQIIKFYGSDDINDRSFSFIWDSDNGIKDTQQCRIISTSGNISAQIQSTLAVSEWNHIACVFDGEYLYSYLNGKLEARELIDITVTKGAGVFRIGAGGPNITGVGRYFNGGLDEVLFFKKALTQSDVEMLYGNP